MALSPTYAENIKNQITNQDVVITLHTANPELEGDNPATLDSVTVLSDGWSAPEDVAGGRGSTNIAELSFGVASEIEELTHFMVWEIDEETPIGSWALQTPQTTSPGNPVVFPAGSLAIVGRKPPA